MHANCKRTTNGSAQLNIEYSILYHAIQVCIECFWVKRKTSHVVLFVLMLFHFFFEQVSKQQAATGQRPATPILQHPTSNQEQPYKISAG